MEQNQMLELEYEVYQVVLHSRGSIIWMPRLESTVHTLEILEANSFVGMKLGDQPLSVMLSDIEAQDKGDLEEGSAVEVARRAIDETIERANAEGRQLVRATTEAAARF
jgi:hypothetical protein